MRQTPEQIIADLTEQKEEALINKEPPETIECINDAIEAARNSNMHLSELDKGFFVGMEEYSIAHLPYG